MPTIILHAKFNEYEIKVLKNLEIFKTVSGQYPVVNDILRQLNMTKVSDPILLYELWKFCKDVSTKTSKGHLKYFLTNFLNLYLENPNEPEFKKLIRNDIVSILKNFSSEFKNSFTKANTSEERLAQTFLNQIKKENALKKVSENEEEDFVMVSDSKVVPLEQIGKRLRFLTNDMKKELMVEPEAAPQSASMTPSIVNTYHS